MSYSTKIVGQLRLGISDLNNSGSHNRPRIRKAPRLYFAASGDEATVDGEVETVAAE